MPCHRRVGGDPPLPPLEGESEREVAQASSGVRDGDVARFEDYTPNSYALPHVLKLTFVRDHSI